METRTEERQLDFVPVGDLEVARWRYECLARAGYPAEEAIILCERSDVDLHEACALLERGASLETAMRILA